MTVEIHLENNYFPWNTTEENHIKYWLKGDLVYNNNFLRGSDIISLFSSLPDISEDYDEALNDLLINFNGSFALVVQTSTNVLAVVDWIRSIPVFFSLSNSSLIIIDQIDPCRLPSPSEYSEISLAELLVTGFVTDDNTLLEGYKQLKPGHYLNFDMEHSKLIAKPYFEYRYDTGTKKIIVHDYISELDDVFLRIFKRYINLVLNVDKKVVIPLSGGMDSRIIAAMFKRLNFNDVTCFSYGLKNNKETLISQSVADSLQYKWLFSEYTKQSLYSQYNSPLMEQYLNYAGNCVSLPHIQDFFAVRQLLTEGKIQKNSIFLPGHSGDLFRGHLLDDTDYNQKSCSHKNATQAIFSKHYRLWNLNNCDDIKTLFLEKINQNIQCIDINSPESYINALDSFNINERQAKFTINSVRVYDYFGCSWGLPLFDRELVDFFLKVPIDVKFHDKLLIKWYNSKIASQFPELKNIECTTNLLTDISCNSLKNLSLVIDPIKKIIRSGNNYMNPDLGSMCAYRNPLVKNVQFYLKGVPIIDKKISEIQTIKKILQTQKNYFPNCNGILTLMFLEKLLGQTNFTKS